MNNQDIKIRIEVDGNLSRILIIGNAVGIGAALADVLVKITEQDKSMTAPIRAACVTTLLKIGGPWDEKKP